MSEHLELHLGRAPGTAERWRAVEIQVPQILHRHAVMHGGGEDVDALGDLGAIIPDDLDAEQPTALALTGDANQHLLGSRMVDLAVPMGAVHGERGLIHGMDRKVRQAVNGAIRRQA